MKKLTELDIESGTERIKTTILNDTFEENRAEKWIQSFLNHFFTVQDEKTSPSIPVSKEEREND
ncbi:MAG: hypothetical protein A2Z14_01745 [Chloroflexi bacterium RBG_16_48_8]|nr:MAG: hypothetical protein A2Z14_01745 [Chloroflexi bacterium RBG_16_48_8]